MEIAQKAVDPNMLEMLRQFQTSERPTFLSDLIGLFCQSSQASMARLREGAKSGDLKKVAEAAHSIKSSAANLGALPLSEICEQIESIGRNGSVAAEWNPLLVKIEEAYARAIVELKAAISA